MENIICKGAKPPPKWRKSAANFVEICMKKSNIVQNCCTSGRNKKNQILFKVATNLVELGGKKVAANLVENKEIRYCSKLLQIW